MNNQTLKVQTLLKENQLDGFLFYSAENRYWYSDFISTLGYLLITKQNATLLVDGRYITEAQLKAKNVEVLRMEQIKKTLQTTIGNYQITKLGVEAEFVTIALLEQWQEMLPGVEIIPVKVHELRMIKDEKAITRIKKACAIGDQAFQAVLNAVKPGMTEKEVEIIITNSFLQNGAEKPSFDTIVASGSRSAMPHGKASSKIINDNEIITCDFGCIYQGYCSDMTRTFALGAVSEKLKTIHEIVKTAQMMGIKAIKPGIKIGEIDKICRDYITEKGYGEYFGHGTGHGLGIEIHEAPWVIANEKTILAPGMVITVEPGIYLPNVGGVRIEDDVLVTETGFEILTHSDRNLFVYKEKQHDQS